MRRFVILGSIVVTGIAAVAVTAQGLPGVTAAEQVGESLYRIPGNGGNTIAFVRADDVVLVDTKIPASGASILAELRKVTDKPVGMVINTHSHPDHVGSNAFFTDAGTVEVVAQVNSAARMRAGGGPMPALRVDKTFTRYMKIGEGADTVEVHHFGAGHIDGDAFVVFPSQKAMAAGDIYAWHMAPLIDPGSGGSVLAAPTTLTAAYYTIDGVDKVITGHGDVRSWEDFRSYVQFNRTLVQTAETTVQNGGTVDDAYAALQAMPSFQVFMGSERMAGLEYGGTPRSRVKINLTVAFQELQGQEPQLIMNLPPDQQ